MRSRGTVQSPRGYDLQNLTAAQLGGRLRAGANATLRDDLRQAMQDEAFLKRRSPAEAALGLTDGDCVFGFLPGDIQRYGAEPGGSTDCSDAIETARDVCAALSGLGHKIRIDAGLWLVTRTIDIAAAIDIKGAGMFRSILYADGFTADQAVFNVAGTDAARISATNWEDFAFWSADGNARAITSSWHIQSLFKRLYFYQCYRGWRGLSSFTNKFLQCSSFDITEDAFLLGVDCNNIDFSLCRLVGKNGCRVDDHAHNISFASCDFEGITDVSGAAIKLEPATGTIVHGVKVSGGYFENIQGAAIQCSGADARSVRGLRVSGAYITGGYQDYFSSTGNVAQWAVILQNVDGFSFEANHFDDWKVSAFFTDGTEQNGSVTNNASGGRVPDLVNSQGFAATVERQNNFADRGITWVTVAPSGAGQQGDIAYNLTPAKGDPVGWVATATSGSDANWVPFGFSVLSASDIYAGTTLTAGTQSAATVVAVTGAALGDFVEASYSGDLQGAQLFGWVNAANQVSYSFVNKTAGSITIPGGTARLRVCRK